MSHVPPGDQHPPYLDPAIVEADYEGKPTEEQLATLRRVPGNVPMIAYLICFIEFCERASYYGVQPLISNYVNRPLPRGGNGLGAPPSGDQQTPGALGMGTVAANAVTQSFSMLAYALPLLFGWMSDAKTGRFKLICWGVGVFGIAHVLMVAAGARDLLANGTAKVPFFLSVYILSIGAGEFVLCHVPGLLINNFQQCSSPMCRLSFSTRSQLLFPQSSRPRAANRLSRTQSPPLSGSCSGSIS